MQDPNSDRLLSRTEVEDRFGITKRFLEVATMRSTGPKFVRIGRSVRYRVKDLEAWIDDNTVQG
jgi:predicted DNA-binding transcriptional regulator AlpA